MKKRYLLLVVPSLLVLIALSLELGLICENLVILPVYFLACIMGFTAAIAGIYVGARSGKRGVLFAALCLIIIGAYLLLPSVWRFRRSMEFSAKRVEYMEVIELVRQGSVTPGERGLANIPQTYQHLMPCTDQIAAEENDRGLFIIFFYSNYMFGEFTGYMYASDDRAPTIQQFRELRELSPDYWDQIKRVDTNWYYVTWSH